MIKYIIYIPWGKAWQPTPVFFPGEFHRQKSLAGNKQYMGSQKIEYNWVTFFFSPLNSLRLAENLWKVCLALEPALLNQPLCRLFSSVQSLSHVQLFSTPWTAARQASLSVANSRSWLKLMSLSQWYYLLWPVKSVWVWSNWVADISFWRNTQSCFLI